MPITPGLVANSLAPGSCYPPSLQLLLNLIAQNLSVTGLASSTFFSFGPSTPPVDAQGMPWLKTDAQHGFLGVYTFAGGAWTPQLSPFITGMVIPIFTNPPANSDPWFLCDGIQTARGFTTPNLQGRTLICTGTRTLPSGSTDTATNYTSGLTGGMENVALTASNIPAHGHGALASQISASSVVDSRISWFDNKVTPADAIDGLIVGGNTTGISSDGSTYNPPVPTQILNPYYAMPMYMYIAPAFP